MKFSKILIQLTFTIVFFIFIEYTNCRVVQYPIRSDVIVTNWPTTQVPHREDDEPGWMRRTLMKFGQVVSRVGNTMGTHSIKITSAVDQICEIVKTIVPFLAAVCHVGQFKFCAATNAAPEKISDALLPDSLNLDVLDRR